MSLSVHEREAWQALERQLAADPEFAARVARLSARPGEPGVSSAPRSGRAPDAWAPRPATPARAGALVLVVIAGVAGLALGVGVFLLTAPLAMAAAAFVLWGPRGGGRGRRWRPRRGRRGG